MAFAASSSGRFYVLRWTATPELVDIQRLNHDIPTARRHAGAPIVALTIISPGIDIPSGEVRRAMVQYMHVWKDNCEVIYVVLCDTGFRGTLIRFVVAELMATMKRGLVRVSASMDAATVEMAARLGEEPEELRRRIDAVGLLGP